MATTELCELGLLLVFEQQNMSELSTSLFVPCLLTNECTHVFGKGNENKNFKYQVKIAVE